MNAEKNIAAVVPEFYHIELQELPMPTVRPDDVLIRVEYVGICGSNIHMFQHGPTQPPTDPNTKLVFGHECAGTVVGLGSAVKKFQIGDRVVIEPGVPCGKCKYCLSGHYNLCPDVDFIDVQPTYYGALRKYLAFPASSTYLLPENVSTLEGALVEPAAVGIHAAELAGVKPGKRIVILGAGCIGLMTLQACRIMGASEIIVVDLVPRRLDMAKQFGAMRTCSSAEEDAVKLVQELFEGGADIVFETAGAKPTAMMTTRMVSRGGKIMIVGTIPGDTPINFLSINREVTIQTVFRYCNNFPMTLDAIASGRFDVKSMITNIYDFTETQRAFDESLSQRQHIIKSVIRVCE